MGFTGDRCQKEVGCQDVECLNGGTCRRTDSGSYSCLCASGYSGEYCNDLVTSDSGQIYLTPIIASLFVILFIAALAVFLIIFCRQHRNQFRHKRMAPDTDGANVEISNPIYMKDFVDDDTVDEFALDPDKPTNFSNPMYDSLYNEPGGSGINDITVSDAPTDSAENSRLLSKASSAPTDKSRRKHNKSTNKIGPTTPLRFNDDRGSIS
jgi:hypothetical protein